MTKSKKGSKAWLAKLSKAQKASWAKRKQKEFNDTMPKTARAPKAAEELSETSIEDALRTMDEEAIRRQIKNWYDEAASPKERQLRKIAMHGFMYGSGPKSFSFDGGKDNLSNVPKEDPHLTSTTKWHLREVAEEPKAFYGSTLSDNLGGLGSPAPASNTNPKTLTGNSKVPVLSVIPPASIIAQATAMRYGAFFAPRTDGTKGYGPYNWRDQPIEAHVYIDAAMRHLMQWFDGDESEIVRDDEGRAIDEVSHLAFALATIGILLDAKANETLIDDRPKARRAAATTLLNSHKLPRYTK